MRMITRIFLKGMNIVKDEECGAMPPHPPTNILKFVTHAYTQSYVSCIF